MQTWEQIALGAIIVVIMLLGFPRIKGAMKEAEDKPKDWAGVLIPVAVVVLFILVLIQLA
ncbi:MAG: hypothetical protein KTR18_15110 [Acidiferrobacterales bacterium]|nr:hypothetical protein [Acidiferrobacterales bacterium]